MTDVRVDPARVDEAPDILDVIRTAFGARPPLDPPAPALQETTESIARALAGDGGLVARLDGEVVGALLFRPADRLMRFVRVGVDPAVHHRGVASVLVGAAEEEAVRRGYHRAAVAVRAELPSTQRFWSRRGYVQVDSDGPLMSYAKGLPVHCCAATADATRDLGTRLGRLLRAGDLVLLSGELGAGKTTLTQGIGEGLGVRGPVTSPTFVISRVHPSVVGGPALVHVDAYRLGSAAELDDLDLDTSLEDAVTVVEWGEGFAETLAADRLEVTLGRPHAAAGAADGVAGGSGAGAGADGVTADAGEGEPRELRITPVGRRWVDGVLPEPVG